MALDATVGGSGSNSFVDITYATTFFAGRTDGEKWWTAQSDERERALLTVCPKMQELDYVGVRVSDTQALKWPRSLVKKPDSASSWGGGYAFFENTEIPKDIKDAQCEWALVALDENVNTGSELRKVSSISLGPLSVAVKPSASPVNGIPPQVMKKLRNYLLNPSGVPIVRG